MRHTQQNYKQHGENMDYLEQVKEDVKNLLDKDNTGHNFDHIERVLYLSQKFAKKAKANLEIVSLIALLHDVDDYKLFGAENAKNLTNTKNILQKHNISPDIQQIVISEIGELGYNKRLEGHCPKTLEGKIVSDADMCDGIGVHGIIRSHQYSLAHGENFFDKNLFPRQNLTADEYRQQVSSSSVNHAFEKLLRVKSLMLTKEGRAEAKSRHKIMVDILSHYFAEEDNQDWQKYLHEYLKNLK